MPQGDRHLSKLLNQHNYRFSLERLSKTVAGTLFCLGCWGQSLPSVANSAHLDNFNSQRDRTSHLLSQNSPQSEPQPSPTNNNSMLQGSGSANDISPEIINSSPVLQKWLKGIPDVLDDIKNAPSFRTRVKVGYSQYPSAGQSGGIHLAVDDVFFGKSGLSASANYNSAANANRTAYGVDAQYYLLPLGGYINITPLVGFRHLQTDKYNRDGLNLGVKLMLVPSRGGGADIAISQSWVGFGSDTETGLTTLSVGYALTNNLRLSTDIQQQNARENYDSRVGFGVEWMP